MKVEHVKRGTLRGTGLAGALIFLGFFYMTIQVPGWVENVASTFIEVEVSEAVNTTIDALEPPAGEGALRSIAREIYRQNASEIEQGKAALKEQLHEKMAAAIAEIRDLDCACREHIADRIRRGYQADIALLTAANEKLTEFVQVKYLEVSSELKRDLRIFTGANAGVFLLLLLVSFMKPGAIGHLFLPAGLLVLATGICCFFYLFEQNWLLTIIYQDYTGFAYLGYLGVVFSVLCDIVYNEGRVTTEVLNTVLNILGSSLQLATC